MANATTFDPHSWTTKDGVTHSIKDMEDRHIFSALKFLYGLSESEIRAGIVRLADDMEREAKQTTHLSRHLRDVAANGSIRKARITYTPQIPHLEAEAELRGIEGWRYPVPHREVLRSISTVLSNASEIVKAYSSISHNPNVPIKPFVLDISGAVGFLEKSGFRVED